MSLKKEESEIQIPITDITIDKEEVLGRGGFGHVFAGNMADGKKVAVKMLIAYGHLPKRNIMELKREARRLKELSHHSGIIDLYGVLMEKDNYGLVLEYMHFGSATYFVKAFKQVDLSLLLRMTCQVAQAMKYLHSYQEPILHLDLKADNVLIDSKFNAKVGDFGLSEWKTVSKLVTTGDSLAGRRCTITHIAPEVIRDINHKSTKKLDIYAFAVTIWEFFTAQRPYGLKDEQMIKYAVSDKQRPDLGSLYEDTPDIVKLMIQKCWHDNPAERPAFKAICAIMEDTYKDHKDRLYQALKSVRQKILESYNVNDPQHIDTEYIDTLDADEMDSVPMETEVANYPKGGGFDGTEKIEEQELQDSQMPLSSPPLIYTPRVRDLNQDDVQLRKLLQNPLAFELVQSGVDDIVPLSLEALKVVRNPVKLRRYIDNDPELRNQLLRSGSPLLSKMSAPNIRETTTQGRYEQHINNSLNKLSTPQHEKNCSNMDELSANEQRRVKRAQGMRNCSYMDKLTNNQLGFKLLKSLKEPVKLKMAVENKHSSEAGGPKTFETVDRSVLEAAQDPLLLQTLLVQDYTMLDNLMRYHPDLMMKLISANKINDKSTSSNNSSQASNSSQRTQQNRGRGFMPEVDLSRIQRMHMDNKNHTQNTALKGTEDDRKDEKKTDTYHQRKEDKKLANQTKMDKIIEEARRRSEEENRRRENDKQKEERERHEKEEQMKNKDTLENSQSGAQGGIISSLYGLFRPSNKTSLLDGAKTRIPIPEQPTSLQSMDDFSMEEGDELFGGGKVGLPFRSHGEPLQPRPESNRKPPSPTLNSYPQQRNVATSSNQSVDRKANAGGLSSTRQTPPPGGAFGEWGGATGNTQNITISHAHAGCRFVYKIFRSPEPKAQAGGGFSHITLNPDAHIPTNIQVGNKNMMVIRDGSHSDDEIRSDESLKKKPKKRRHREIKLPDQPLNMDRMDMVCTRIGKDWKKLARDLGLEEPQIEQIHQDFHINGSYEIMYQVLQKWMQKNGKAATIRALGQHLSNIDRHDLMKLLK